MRSSPELHDEIQEAVIARARERNMTAYAVAMATEGRVSENAVREYMARRASMGSHKLQHVLRALGLTITPEKR